ncbi:hypothetical protein [Streptomyces xanthophaeus]
MPPALRDRLAQDPNLRVALRVFARQDTPELIRAAIHARIVSDVPPLDWLADHQALDDDELDRQLTGEIARAELRTLRLPWVTADPVPSVRGLAIRLLPRLGRDVRPPSAAARRPTARRRGEQCAYHDGSSRPRPDRSRHRRAHRENLPYGQKGQMAAGRRLPSSDRRPAAPGHRPRPQNEAAGPAGPRPARGTRARAGG